MVDTTQFMMHPVSFVYRNYKGETSTRRVNPVRIWWGQTLRHKEDQWFLEAYDLERQSERTFAMNDISGWRQATDEDLSDG